MMLEMNFGVAKWHAYPTLAYVNWKSFNQIDCEHFVESI